MPHQPLSVPALRAALNRLVDAVEEQLGDEIDFKVDYYWDVPTDQAYQTHSEPELLMGQLSDDIDSVHEFSNDPDEVVAIWHECEHIAGVLRAIANRALS